MQSRTFWKTLTIHLTVVVGLAISGGAPSASWTIPGRVPWDSGE
jgi:hypothetical protein